MSFSGKVAIVTGDGHEIGKEGLITFILFLGKI